MSKYKLIAINAVVFIAVSIVVDIALGAYFNLPIKYTCKDSTLHHKYCPSSTRVYVMRESDGGRVIKSYWNNQGIRVEGFFEKYNDIKINEYDVINVGDSFMAQRQVAYTERVSNIIENLTDKKTIQVGTGSWAPLIYKQWVLNNDFKEGVILNVFVMNNDLYSYGYTMSNLNYYKIQGYEREPRPHFVIKGEVSVLKAFIMNNSFIYQNYVVSKKYAPSNKGNKYKTLKKSVKGLEVNCAKINDFEGITPYALSNVLYSFDSKCWPEVMWENFNSVLSDINEIYEYVQKYKGVVNVFFVPDGWAFKGESLGVKSHPNYNIGEDVVISNEGLVRELKSKISCCKLIDMTEEIRKIKKQKEHNLYYPYDGHWNRYGSEIAAGIIAREIKYKSNSN